MLAERLSAGLIDQLVSSALQTVCSGLWTSQNTLLSDPEDITRFNRPLTRHWRVGVLFCADG
jgi:hypothetical protein